MRTIRVAGSEISLQQWLDKSEEEKKHIVLDLLNRQHHHARVRLDCWDIAEFVVRNLDVLRQM